MRRFEYTIQNALGIHGNHAVRISREAARYQSAITVIKGEKVTNALRLMALVGLGARCGDTVTVTIQGEDEDAAAAAMEDYFRQYL